MIEYSRGDETLMLLALEEARKGAGRTSPNPCVGAVIVKDKKVIAKGFHEKAGQAHAEINALRLAGEYAHGATVYVTLEPCSHTGKTPPCCEALVRSGVSRVVYGMRDPNPLVSGKGIAYLEKHGVKVLGPVLEQQCMKLNESFITYITTGKPLVVLKAAISLDGRISYAPKKPGRITGDESRAYVHEMRNRYDAIMVGTTTVESDNPSLTTRLAKGGGKDPHRIILDAGLRLKPDLNVFVHTSKALTLVFHGPSVSLEKVGVLRKLGVRLFQVDIDSENRIVLEQVLTRLAAEGITSLFVEGGGVLFSSFLQQKLAQKLCLFQAPLFAGSAGQLLTHGFTVEDDQGAIRINDIVYTRLGDDMLIEGQIIYP